MPAKRRPDHNAAIQFRPGESFGKLLASFEKKWGLSRHEAARRLAIMGALELELEFYEPLAEAAERLGGLRGFESACEYVNGAFHGASMARPDPRGFADPEKKKRFVVHALRILTGRYEDSEIMGDEEKEGEEQKRKLRVRETRT
jgi:hypothetical protein